VTDWKQRALLTQEELARMTEKFKREHEGRFDEFNRAEQAEARVRELERQRDAFFESSRGWQAREAKLREAIQRHQQQIKMREDGRRISSVAADTDLWAALSPDKED